MSEILVVKLGGTTIADQRQVLDRGKAPLRGGVGTHAEPLVHGRHDPFFPVGGLYYWKSLLLKEASDEALDAVWETLHETRPTAMNQPTAFYVPTFEQTAVTFGNQSKKWN